MASAVISLLNPEVDLLSPEVDLLNPKIETFSSLHLCHNLRKQMTQLVHSTTVQSLSNGIKGIGIVHLING